MLGFNHILDLLVVYERYVLLVLMVLFLLSLVVFITINIRMGKLVKHYRSLLAGMEDKNLEEMLYACFEQGKNSAQKVEEFSANLDEVKAKLQGCAQKVSIVRFNAFEDVGGEMSFALAILDQNDNGFILSNVYGRQESHVYVRPIQGGKPNSFLLPEEEKALVEAQSK